ncbi:MAG: TIGR01777 family oxidoreductase [Brachybacterium sp.]|nr:TIGR01777 family oxidoreductase [Brachybacterium sp.]
MRFEHTTRLDHPHDEVIDWHERPGALVRLTPPGLGGPEDPFAGGMEEGTRVTVRMGPPVLPGSLRPRWVLRHAQHERTEDSLVFEDRQVTGPFGLWHHRHEILADTGQGGARQEGADGAGGATLLRDRIDLELPAPLAGQEAAVTGQLERLMAFRSDQLREDLDFHARYAESPRVTVAIAGASGLIGTQLAALLTTAGHTVRRMVRREARSDEEISWDPERGVLDAGDLEGVDAVVNLAGRSIATRMNRRARQEILSSRVSSGDLIARTLAGMTSGPRTLVQASAVGFYGAQRPGELLTEDDPGGDGFLAEVCSAWEATGNRAADAGIRVAHMRTGIVLSDAGGALLPQLPMFAVGLGGRLSRADAVISWITLDDMVRSYAHALLSETVEGPVNAVGPHPATTQELARTLGRVLRRPSVVPVPGFGPALLLGRTGATELVQADQRASSAKLEASGFTPAHPDLEGALRHVLRR